MMLHNKVQIKKLLHKIHLRMEMIQIRGKKKNLTSNCLNFYILISLNFFKLISILFIYCEFIHILASNKLH